MAKTWSSYGPSILFFLNLSQCAQGCFMPDFALPGLYFSPLSQKWPKYWLLCRDVKFRRTVVLFAHRSTEFVLDNPFSDLQQKINAELFPLPVGSGKAHKIPLCLFSITDAPIKYPRQSNQSAFHSAPLFLMGIAAFLYSS